MTRAARAGATSPVLLAARRGGSALGDGLLSRQRHRDVVEAHRIFEHQAVERGLAEGRLRRGMPRRFRMRPWAVETREVARPQEVAEADLGHAPEAALFLHFERKEDLPPYKFAGLVG